MQGNGTFKRIMRADASAVLCEVADVSEGLYACQRQLGSAFDMNL